MTSHEKSGVPAQKEKIVRTSCLRTFQNEVRAGCPAAFLTRIQSKRTIHDAFLSTIGANKKLEFRGKFNWRNKPVVKWEHGRMRINPVVLDELKLMFKMHFNIHSDAPGGIWIRRGVYAPAHADSIDTLNCNWGDSSTEIETDDGFEAGREGDIVYCGKGIRHRSSPASEKEKVLVTVFAR
ncbi:MAG: hypothetical protein AAF204_02420 [Pseudomonadota bacterium]